LPPAETERLVGLTVKTPRLLDMLERLRAALPGLEIVNDCWLLAPMATLPNTRDEGDTEITGVGAATPLPVTVTLVGLPEAL
jgi:hypothetical protein